jgi:hypothetical protein
MTAGVEFGPVDPAGHKYKLKQSNGSILYSLQDVPSGHSIAIDEFGQNEPAGHKEIVFDASGQ